MLMFLASICFQKSRKLKDLRTFFRFFWKKKWFLQKNVFDDFEAFLRLFVFEKSRKFANDCRKIKIMMKGFNIVKNYFFAEKLFFCQKNSKTGPQILKFSTFLETNWGWKHQHQKVEKLLFVVKNEKCLEEKKCFFFVNSTNVVNSTNRHWLVLQTESCFFEKIGFFSFHEI